MCAKSAPRRGHKAFLHGLDVFERMAADGLEPDLISFNCLLNIASKGAAVPQNSKWSTNGLKVLAMMEVSCKFLTHLQSLRTRPDAAKVGAAAA